MTDFTNYFSSYEDLEVHEIMLRDRPRQEAYRDAIEQCKAHIAGKVVLDVGCGTGILSVLCAQAGAARVLAVEASQVANLANEVVHENNVQHIVQVFHSTIEEFQLPDGLESVDIIISEWMGFYLLHEAMLDSVINARDRFLAHDGLMFPCSATITIAPCAVPTRFDAWHNVDGVSMRSVGRAIRAQKSLKPEVLAVQEADLLHDGTVLAWLDLRDVSLAELESFRFKDVIVAERAGRYQGVCIWFDVEFPILTASGDSVVLSTGPQTPQTHWMQTVVALPEQSHESVEPRDPIAFSLVVKRNADNKRRYNMELTLLDQDQMEHPVPCSCIMTKCILVKAHLATLPQQNGGGTKRRMSQEEEEQA